MQLDLDNLPTETALLHRLVRDIVGQLESKRSAISPDVLGPLRSIFRMSRLVSSARARNAALVVVIFFVD